MLLRFFSEFPLSNNTFKVIIFLASEVKIKSLNCSHSSYFCSFCNSPLLMNLLVLVNFSSMWKKENNQHIQVSKSYIVYECLGAVEFEAERGCDTPTLPQEALQARGSRNGGHWNCQCYSGNKLSNDMGHRGSKIFWLLILSHIRWKGAGYSERWG